jgi:glycosyltransferase involved in cell wall biosynthesis
LQTPDVTERPTKVVILSKHLDEQGGVVHVVQSVMAGANQQAQFLHLPIGSRPGGLRSPRNWIFPVLDVVQLARTIRKWKPDCVHINPSLTLPSMLRDGMLLLAVQAIRFRNRVVMFHGWEMAQIVRLRRNPLLRAFFLATFRRATCTLVLAKAFKEQLVSIGFDPGRVIVVPAMFDGRVLQEMPPRQQVAATRVLFLSRFVAPKGVYTVLEAVRSLIESGQDVRLLLAGDGPEQKRMQEWVRAHGLADRITFAGYVRGVDKARVFAESDIFAFPTRYPEGCPVSLLEALAAGLPVVCSAVGGMADVVENERNGVVLEDPTVEATARGIRLFHENRELARRVGEVNRAYAWTEFESGVVARLIAEVYRRASSQGA